MTISIANDLFSRQADPAESLRSTLFHEDGTLDSLTYAELLLLEDHDGLTSLREVLNASGVDVSNPVLSELVDAADATDVELTGAEVVALLLQARGTGTVFAYAGTSELALCDSIDRSARLRLINGRGDKESAFMAAGGSLLTPNRAVAVLHGARGLTNAAGGVADARRNEAGTVFLVGLPSTGSAPFLPPHGEHDLLPAIGTFTNWWWQVPAVPDEPAERERAAFTFSTKLIEALDTSASLPTRPSMFGIPQDVAEQRWIPLASVRQAIGANATQPPASGGASMLNQAVEQFADARRPLLLVDDYALRYPGVHRALDRISRLLGAPVLQLRYRRGPMLFERLRTDDVANFVGWLNQFSAAHNDLLANCDLFITVEDRNIYRRVVGNLPPCPKTAINGDGDKVRKNAYLNLDDLLLEGHVTEIMESLSDLLEQRGIRRQPWFSLDVIGAADVTPEPAPVLAEHLRTSVASALAEVLSVWSQPVLIDDSQMFGGLVAERYDLLPRGLRVFGGHGGFVGGGLAYATGLAIADPDVNVMCLLGDQAFTNSFQGLVAAVQERARVLFVVCNNGESVSLKKQAGASNPHWFAGGTRPYLSNAVNLSYHGVASALGVWSAQVEIPFGPDMATVDRATAEFIGLLKQARDSRGPALVELRLPSDPDAWRGIWLTQGFEQKEPIRI